MLLAFAAAQAAIPTELGPAWAEFSRQPALERIKETVEIGTLGRERSTGKLRYWLRYTRTGNGVEQVRWADSATCTAVRQVLEDMREIETPQLNPPGVVPNQRISITVDGVGYLLRAPATFGDRTGNLTMSSNIGTPLADWVEASVKRLENCWTEVQPKRS